jgi:hypothetical protein
MQQSILVFFRVSKERLKRLHVRRFTRLSNLPPNSPKPDDSGYRLDACSYGGRCVSPFAHCFFLAVCAGGCALPCCAPVETGCGGFGCGGASAAWRFAELSPLWRTAELRLSFTTNHPLRLSPVIFIPSECQRPASRRSINFSALAEKWKEQKMNPRGKPVTRHSVETLPSLRQAP